MSKFVFITPERLVYKPNYDSPEPDFIDMEVLGFDRGQTMEEALEDLLGINGHLVEDNLEETYLLDLANESRQFFLLHNYKDGRQVAS